MSSEANATTKPSVFAISKSRGTQRISGFFLGFAVRRPAAITCQHVRHIVRLRKVKSNSALPRRSALLSFRFVTVSTVGSLATALVCAFGPIEAQIGMLGALLSALAGLFLSYLEQDEERERRLMELLGQLAVPVALASDPELHAHHTGFRNALNTLAMQNDPILREIAALKAASMRQEITSLADGTIVFTGTEAWRTVYEKLLSSPDVTEYQSVALVRTKEYWQDPPGRQSLEANLAAVRKGVLIERTVILRDELWPEGEGIPSGEIGRWIEEQHNHGLWVCLVRESRLSKEPDLLADMGIYGNRAVGVQELDEHSQTVRFTLQFDPHEVHLARERWQRLQLFATSYRQLLDRLPDEE